MKLLYDQHQYLYCVNKGSDFQSYDVAVLLRVICPVLMYRQTVLYRKIPFSLVMT